MNANRTPPRLVLGDNHLDPLDQLAYQRVAEHAGEAFEIALHYQGKCSMQAHQEALHNALAVAAPAIVAAALVQLVDDPVLGLTEEQSEYLTDLAVSLDLHTVENLSGANGDGGPAD